MKKNAWLITQDGYIDRRILFFVNVLQELGYNVILFASYYFDVEQDMDPYYIKRPVAKSIIKEYGVESNKLDKEICEIIEEITQAENDASVQKTLKNKIRKRGSSGGRMKIRLLKKKEILIAEIKTKDRTILYNGKTKTCQIFTETYFTEGIEFERILLEYMENQENYPNNTLFKKNGIYFKICSESDWQGEHKRLYMQKPGCNEYYLFDFAEQVLIKVMPQNGVALSEALFGTEDFRKFIYEYSPVWHSVKQQMENSVPDIVYVADLPTLPIGVMVKEQTQCRLMVDCHEWWFKQLELWNKRQDNKIRIAEHYENELYPKCDLRITVGHYLARDMEQYYEQKFEVIYSCLSRELSYREYGRADDFWHKKFGISSESKIAIFQGSMTTLRNLENLARSTKYLKEKQYLVMVGGGEFEKDFLKILKKEGEPARVIMAGWVKQSELQEYTVNADLGVIPYVALNDYFSYSVPNKCLEFFAGKLPILFDSSMKEISVIVEENQVGRGADLSDARLFGEAVGSMLGDEEGLERMRQNYYLCEGKYGYESQRKHFKAILKEYCFVDGDLG
ncbi:glycosyltransferase [Anaerovorax sp. IOR16]|uniref:glycosyltransferase n=1 Tax=Anaerovorax sp. IOR16 TaxID=2773458 RepID=UPI0019CFA5A4|nr:glycosyltransferase [Anaerovorax sp. IOR16]